MGALQAIAADWSRQDVLALLQLVAMITIPVLHLLWQYLVIIPERCK